MRKMNYLLFLIFFSVISISAVEYAEMYMLDNSTNQISGTLSADTWQQVEGFTQGNVSGNWNTSTTNQLSKSYTSSSENGNGKYIVRYSVSFEGSIGDWELGIAVNSTANMNHIVTRRISDNPTLDVGNAAGGGIIVLSAEAPESIKLYFKNKSDATDFTVKHAQVIITEMKQADSGTYGELYYNTGVTHQPKPTGQDIKKVWTTLTTFNQTQNLSNINSGTNSLVIQEDGFYLVSLSMSFWGDEDSNYNAGISIDGSAPAKSKLGRYFPGYQDLGSAACYGIFSLETNQTISVEAIESNDHDFFLSHGNLNVVMLETEGDESSKATPYASMGGASTVDITASNTDALVETSNIYTDSNFWSFSSNTLHPINLSAGYYMVHYYMSMTYTDGDAESALYLLTSLYKNNINQTNLISERKLQKRDGSDIGSTSGSGLIKIESPTDNLTFKVNDDNGKDIDITKLNITIQRVGTIDNGTLPVELSSFDAMITSTDNVSLNWTVQSETNGSGYRIYRNAINDFNSALMLEEFVSALNLSQTHTYSFVDSEIDDSYLNVFYWLQFIELDNSTQLYGPVMVHLENNQEDVPEIIFNEGIKSAYPNPFNPDVTISYYLNSPKAANFQVYNLKGQLINKLTSATENVGFHQISWDGKDVSGRSVSSGTYFIKATNLKNDTPIKVILSK